MDMAQVPMPNVEVVSARAQTVEAKAPEEHIITEAAVKRRTAPLLVMVVRQGCEFSGLNDVMC